LRGRGDYDRVWNNKELNIGDLLAELKEICAYKT